MDEGRVGVLRAKGFSIPYSTLYQPDKVVDPLMYGHAKMRRTTASRKNTVSRQGVRPFTSYSRKYRRVCAEMGYIQCHTTPMSWTITPSQVGRPTDVWACKDASDDGESEKHRFNTGRASVHELFTKISTGVR